MCACRKTWWSILAAFLVWGGPGASAGPPPQAPASSEPAQLKNLVREALARNPEIQMARRRADAQRARIPQAKAWPDPTVTLGYGGNLLPP